MPDELEQLRTEASSRGYGPMARLARALYEAGLPPEQVLRECYGADLPREVFSIAAADPYTLGLLAKWANQPWQLAVPLDRGGPASQADTYEPKERRVHVLDPDLLPLVFLIRPGIDIEDDGLVLCYRLTELAAGRSTIFGVREDADNPSEATRLGDSLLAVLHRHHTKYLHELEEESANTEDKGEYDFVDPEELREVRALVDRIETFQHEAQT
ncbi:hypothetical protein Ssi03_01150 [Sphaerisporangium siamense]|uniref:Uncharacterized protein n=1 Tax=Sphaerisporangium siamense TaxID=795645 RepID=A0A7W7DE04_9ACTN|nr:hypothetical protein [Sphaerisporangium siamense]MBB4703653.1 hypothetical protein [Sphaerisporangium siamense]GII82125.1 hypothetical protein Ssi03_01150 [Sphaerisporangium siamense]